MAFNKKHKRPIRVDGLLYYYRVTGDDGAIGLVVMADTEDGGKLFCAFRYHQDIVAVPGLPSSFELINQFVVTPYTVRQVILYGLAHGWKPFGRSSDTGFGFIDEKIDLRLDQNRENNFRKAA